MQAARLLAPRINAPAASAPLRCLGSTAVAAKTVPATTADAGGTGAEAVRSSAAASAGDAGPSSAGEEQQWERVYSDVPAAERAFVAHGEDVEHEGQTALKEGESDEEHVAAAAAAGGCAAPQPFGGSLAARGYATSASARMQENEEDEYRGSGEYVEGGDPFFLKEGDAGGAAGLAARSAQSNHAFDDEYPESGEWVPAPGGTASAKWMRWKLEADEAMRGGEPEPGVVID